jgi:hypothetical protein
VQHQPAAVDDDHLLEQVGDLLDEVGRQDHRAGVLQIVGQQLAVEGGPRRRVHAQIDLVQDGQ